MRRRASAADHSGDMGGRERNGSEKKGRGGWQLAAMGMTAGELDWSWRNWTGLQEGARRCCCSVSATLGREPVEHYRPGPVTAAFDGCRKQRERVGTD